MTDIVSKERRSRIMATIGPTDSVPELAVRRFLHWQGFRFRLHVRTLPGRPDVVLPKHRVIIFVHGCFWHQHARCQDAVIPASNRAFWKAKLANNRRRDRIQIQLLRNQGWRVGVFWECAARKGKVDQGALNALVAWLNHGAGFREFARTKESRKY